MIAVIHGLPRRWFDYWQKPVRDRLGRSGQVSHFIAVSRPRDWFSRAPENGRNWFKGVYGWIIASLHTLGIIQIPIVLRHTVPPCLRPAVSSLGACPTPAP